MVCQAGQVSDFFSDVFSFFDILIIYSIESTANIQKIEVLHRKYINK